jgi:hypothetical protein
MALHVAEAYFGISDQVCVVCCPIQHPVAFPHVVGKPLCLVMVCPKTHEA